MVGTTAAGRPEVLVNGDSHATHTLFCASGRREFKAALRNWELTLVMKFFLPVVLCASVAFADDAQRATELFKRGQTFYSQQRYLDAIAAFEQSRQLKIHPAIHYNLARCYEQLNERGRALHHYRVYLELAPHAADSAAVTAIVSKLTRALSERGLELLVVTTHPADARVTIDGQDEPTRGLAVREVKPGAHQISASLEGHLPQLLDAEVMVGTPLSLVLTLERQPVAAPVAAPVAQPTPLVVADLPLTAAPLTTAVVSDAPVERHRLWTWVLAGTAGAATASAIGLGLASRSATAELRITTHTRPEADGLVARANGTAIGANVSYAVAGTTAAIALILFFIEGAP